VKGGLNNIMKRKLVLAWFLVLSGLSINDMMRAQGSLMRKDEVIQVVEAYDRAWNRKDSAGVDRILFNNYVYFTSEGGVVSRQDTLNFLRSPKYILNSAERSELEVHHASSTAVVSSRWKGNGVYDGKAFHDDQRCSLVLIREGQGWKLLSEHCTQIAHQ
jgi:ketosteroid isomerase-like protein